MSAIHGTPAAATSRYAQTTAIAIAPRTGIIRWARGRAVLANSSATVLLDQLAEQMAVLIPEGTEVLAGLEMGGIAVVTALARHAKLPTAFVRKQAKQYGTARLAEGAEVAGRRVLVVEDVVTSGGQVVISTKDLRKLGAHVDHALCVIDRQEGGAQALSEEGIQLRALLTRADLEAAA